MKLDRPSFVCLAVAWCMVAQVGCYSELGFRLTKAVTAPPDLDTLGGIREARSAVRSEDRRVVRICILAQPEEVEPPAEFEVELPVDKLGEFQYFHDPPPDLSCFTISYRSMRIDPSHLIRGCSEHAGDPLPILRQAFDGAREIRFDMEKRSQSGEFVYDTTGEGGYFIAFATTERAIIQGSVVTIWLHQNREPRGPGLKVVLAPLTFIIDLITYPIQVWVGMTGWHHS